MTGESLTCLGKVERHRADRGKRQTPHQQAMSKVARRNQARQLRLHHREKKENESAIFQGKNGVPKHIAILPLSEKVNAGVLIQELNDSVNATSTLSDSGFVRAEVERFKRNLLYIPVGLGLVNALDICRLADWVVLLATPDQDLSDAEDGLLRAIEGQGITNVVAIVQEPSQGQHTSNLAKATVNLQKSINHYFPTLDKVYSSANKADCANLVRSLCTAATKGIRWRDERSWMLIERLDWEMPASSSEQHTTVKLTGVVRGKGLDPDRLVHVPGWGDFQIGAIVESPAQNRKRKADEMNPEEAPKEYVPSAGRDNLETLAPEEADMADVNSTVATSERKGVLLDDHHYFSDDASHLPPPPQKLPKGTSNYQSAWYLDDVSDSDSDILDEEDQDGDVVMESTASLDPADGAVAVDAGDITVDAGPSEYPESEIHVEPTPDEEARDLEEFRASRKKEAEEDLEFPDEIELNPNVLARERLAKYRGLKSLRTSDWNKDEDAPYQPNDYSRLLQIADYKKSRKAATNEALAGGAAPGMKVQVQLLGVSSSLKDTPRPLGLFSLLRHEHKHTVVNLNMTLDSAITEPVKSKEELVVQIGSRRLLINPVFSAGGTTPNDVHKFERFLHPGRTAVASFIGPLSWGSIPVLVFKRSAPSDDAAPALVDAMAVDNPSSESTTLRLIGTATTIPPSNSRVIAKRAILTGHPYKIHKKLVTVRYMFFNKEDVAWFSALPLWTKRGRHGFIKESLGTHGYFKATFDGRINPMDAIGVSLYKRVWPRPARPWTGRGG
jgi:pre-rRNA-processing protein TSR1